VAAIAIAPDGARGASTRGLQACPTGSTVRVWSVANGKMQRMLLGHSADITCVAFSADSRYVFTAARDRTLRQWEADSGLELRRWTLQSVATGVAGTPDGGHVLSVSPREGVVLWKLDAAPLYPAQHVGVGASWEGQWKALGKAPDANPVNASYDIRSAAISAILKRDPAEAVEELERRLNEAPRFEDLAAINKAIVELDDDNYSIRLEASETLQQLGDAARPALIAALESSSLQVRVEAARVLKAIGGTSDIRIILVCELLQMIATPEAKALLATIAGKPIPEATHARAMQKRWPK